MSITKLDDDKQNNKFNEATADRAGRAEHQDPHLKTLLTHKFNKIDEIITKINTIASNAEVNVPSNWNATEGATRILNKPTIPSGNSIIDWTSANAGTINATNYTNTTYTVGDGGLTQKNFTTALNTKLAGIAAGAEVNVQSNWNSSSGDSQILNKPTIPVDLTSDGAGTVHANNYTNTTYSVGNGGLTQNNFTNTLKNKLDGIEELADVTDATTVTAAGALMDSEVTNLSQVKAFDSSDYATAAQGSKADSAQQPPTEGAFANGDKTKLDAIANNANNYSISSDLLDEDNMATNSATKVPSQQSVKAYVDASSGGASALNDLSDVTYANGDLTINSLDKIVTSGNLTLDSGSTLNLDANGGRIKLDRAGTTYAEFTSDGNTDSLIFENAGKIDLKADNFIQVHPGADSIAIMAGGRGLFFVTEDSTNAYTLSSYVRTNCPIQLKDIGAHGDTPGNGYGAIYVNGDKLYFKTDGGTATDLTAGGGGTQEAIFNFSARWYSRYNYWYFPSTNYGHSDLNWRTSFNSTSFPQSWNATYNPIFVAPKAFTLTAFQSYGNVSLSGQSTVDCELALLKGTPNYGNAGSISLSQVGTTRQMTHNTGRMVAMSQAVSGNQNASIAQGDILIPCFRRTSTVSSSYAFYKMNFNIVGEYT